MPENTKPIPTDLLVTQHGIGCGLCGQYLALDASEHSESFNVFHVQLTRVLSTPQDDKALSKRLSVSLKSYLFLYVVWQCGLSDCQRWTGYWNSNAPMIHIKNGTQRG